MPREGGEIAAVRNRSKVGLGGVQTLGELSPEGIALSVKRLEPVIRAEGLEAGNSLGASSTRAEPRKLAPVTLEIFPAEGRDRPAAAHHEGAVDRPRQDWRDAAEILA
jgi:hypothetical protein